MAPLLRFPCALHAARLSQRARRPLLAWRCCYYYYSTDAAGFRPASDSTPLPDAMPSADSPPPAAMTTRQSSAEAVAAPAPSPSSPPTPERTLQAKWAARWAQRPGRLFSYADIAHALLVANAAAASPLAPVYACHAAPSVLEKVRSLRSLRAHAPLHRSVYRHAARLAANLAGRDAGGAKATALRRVDGYVARFGTDAVLLYYTFRHRDTRVPSREARHRSPCAAREVPHAEDHLLDMRRFLARVWEAVNLAHVSYRATQGFDAPHSGAEMRGADYIENQRKALLRSGAHFPMEHQIVFGNTKPNRPKVMMLSDLTTEECRLQLAVKEAVNHMTQMLDSRSGLIRKVEKKLQNLASAIIVYAGNSEIQPRIHYNAARELLCLLAPLTPAFAEEAWIVLLEGPSASNYSPSPGSLSGTEDVPNEMPSFNSMEEDYSDKPSSSDAWETSNAEGESSETPSLNNIEQASSDMSSSSDAATSSSTPDLNDWGDAYSSMLSTNDTEEARNDIEASSNTEESPSDMPSLSDVEETSSDIEEARSPSNTDAASSANASTSGTEKEEEAPSAEPPTTSNGTSSRWQIPASEAAAIDTSHGLPIRGRPETIWSVFDQRFPQQWPQNGMQLLRWRAESAANTCANFPASRGAAAAAATGELDPESQDVEEY
ncbi:uncharacterized protein K452DRAFT_285133 [Aplosporella prunicola CBS 121167]|uniref:Uncharacterized protein n=1 Tax=Aplosporella prunicola CBS 121167 TaxID=1176127 RepID=A0A6A6BL13_9PEZI|nr:uncharacterized protein K452DRAFT_285133 [Aplosporella prunicola CBS 121167]KAF2144799.1 hypothetical protein K452DRAFT_285133 [Aplosporella prunicola CBS 121167]